MDPESNLPLPCLLVLHSASLELTQWLHPFPLAADCQLPRAIDEICLGDEYCQSGHCYNLLHAGGDILEILGISIPDDIGSAPVYGVCKNKGFDPFGPIRKVSKELQSALGEAAKDVGEAVTRETKELDRKAKEVKRDVDKEFAEAGKGLTMRPRNR